MNAGSLIGSPLKTGDGLTFVTLGRLSSNTTVRDNKPALEITPSESSAFQHESSHHHSLQTLPQQQQQQLQHHQQPNVGVADVPLTPSSSSISTATAASSPEELYSNHTTATSLKRKMNIAGWTVPPRVLLVDDDSVYRDLSGKLLQVIGCSIDLAKDGVEALRKMGLEKYDLILMVSYLATHKHTRILVECINQCYFLFW
jgi:osomolarity two-component system response regulator SKN7